MNEHQVHSQTGGDTRRGFLKKTATAAAAVAATGFLKTPVYGQNTAPSANVAGANNKITLGFVGVGRQGLTAHLRAILQDAAANNVAAAAISDVSKHRVDEAKQVVTAAGGSAEGFADYRKLLERKDVDAIFCATVDHWHGRVTVDALNAGKHVYCEKPMTRYLGEAFEVHDTVKKTGKVYQVGSQGCSDQKWHKAAEWVKAGKIGKLVMCQGSYMRNTPKGEWNYDIETWCKPEDVDWKTWHGEQIKTHSDFSPEDYFRWRKYYAFCGGLLSDLFPHKLHPYMLATGNPAFPSRVAAVGSKLCHTDLSVPGTPERDVPEILQMIVEFPDGMVMHMTSSSVNETGTQELMRGQKADLYMGSNRVELKPEKPFADEIDPETSPAFPPEFIPIHQKNFFDSIRGGAQPNANIDLAIRVQTVISLAEMSERLNIMCRFDEKTRKIMDGTGKELAALTYGTLELS